MARRAGPSESRGPMSAAALRPITQTLADLAIGDPASAGNLWVFPLLAKHDREPAYLTLDQALAKGFVRVTEVSEAGSVPTLLVKNAGPQPVLILDGEELVGAKQNRIVNLTILVPAATTLTIPVSCVEAGRWAARSRAFAPAGRAHYASGRAMKLKQVSVSLREDGARLADQGAVWHDISLKAARMDAPSATSAASAMYDRLRAKLDEFEERLRPVLGQVGAVFGVNGRVAGLDVFDCSATWRASMRKLVQSYGLDALDVAASPHGDGRPDVGRFIEAVTESSGETYAALGLGTDVRFESGALRGAALVVDERVVHLVAFPVAGHAESGWPRRRHDPSVL